MGGLEPEGLSFFERPETVSPFLKVENVFERLESLDTWSDFQRKAWFEGDRVYCAGGSENVRRECEELRKKLRKAEIEKHLNFPWTLSQMPLVVNGKLLVLSDIYRGMEKVFERQRMYSALTYNGVSHQQYPLDAFVIADLFRRIRPELVIELGTAGGGGSVLYLSIMRQYSATARVLTIDPQKVPLRSWSEVTDQMFCPPTVCVDSAASSEWASRRISYINELPTQRRAMDLVTDAVRATQGPILVIEDSSHRRSAVLKNMLAYAGFVTPGSFLLVQDTRDTRLGGPAKAIADFFRSTTSLGNCFVVDRRLEHLLYSQHVGGWLQRLPDANCTDAIRAQGLEQSFRRVR